MEENMSLGLQTNFGILEMQSPESYQKSKHICEGGEKVSYVEKVL